MLSLTNTLGLTFDPCQHDHLKSTPWRSIIGKNGQDQRLRFPPEDGGWDPDWPTGLQVASAGPNPGIIPNPSLLNTFKAGGQLNIEPVNTSILNALTCRCPPAAASQGL